jgi:mono/diheme cytochrome c family protein
MTGAASTGVALKGYLGAVMRMRVLLIAAISAGCASDESPSSDTEVPDAATSDAARPATGKHVSFAKEVAPIFQRCVICHHPGGILNPEFDDPFDPTHGLINVATDWHENDASPLKVVVKPGSPDESFLLYKVAADPDPDTFDVEHNGDPMPRQIPRVTDAELATIKRWISDGAKNDAFFTDNVAPIFGSEITLGRKRGKCTYCHYPNSPTGLNILAVFDGKTGLVGADSTLSTKLRVAPGAPDDSFLVEKLEQAMPSGGAQMPLQPERLSAAEVETLRTWIAQGAENN